MIEVGKIEKSGFCPQVIFEGFKTAFITYSEDYGERKIFKRHLETDEVFVLIDGGAVIFTHEGGAVVATPLERGRSYNVKKSTWHHVQVTSDALLFVVENSNTTRENTEIMSASYSEEGVLS